ncbi:Rieske (2Fe-2S) protein [Niabella ginsengisoli]|uniref:Rieske 2Fe-2S domain-containing protein n=1 Tax=Niabella ginsengisoli TaxID=522298 RepID=A0ABS9SMG2_9BACT|nr:Rieske 2Fe-2S domain-containing protein [Niabella ginsengisoli]MCH5599552.1 Rieske 2Fe-2S domain-containing protein [Niabella ginsengisoli]
MNKQLTWHLFALHLNELNFNHENLVEIKVDGKQLCIARVNDKAFACAAKCPHAAASLSSGYVNVQNQIVCPLHRYKFNLENGRNVSGEGYFLKTYPVEEREDGWYVGLY